MSKTTKSKPKPKQTKTQTKANTKRKTSKPKGLSNKALMDKMYSVIHDLGTTTVLGYLLGQVKVEESRAKEGLKFTNRLIAEALRNETKPDLAYDLAVREDEVNRLSMAQQSIPLIKQLIAFDKQLSVF